MSTINIKINSYKLAALLAVSLLIPSLLIAATDEIFKAVAPVELTKKKTWNFIVYMAANNNLHSYAIKNLNQMMTVGSNDSINIIAQIDGLQNNKIKRYYVKKGELITIAENDTESSEVLPSGTPESLYNLSSWTMQNFPADHQALVLWNHGSGIKDPSMWGRSLWNNRDKLFSINYDTGRLIIDRSLFPDVELSGEELAVVRELNDRGIAFNEATRTYITNQELRKTLEQIQQNVLGGKKIDVVCFDACHMGMVELAAKLQATVSFMAGSAEVEPGSGYNYATFLKNCTTSTTPKDFVQNVVKAYDYEYNSVYAELTQIALDLGLFSKTQDLWKSISTQLTLCINEVNGQTKNKSFAAILKNLRTTPAATTEYSDADYIDAQHFLESLIEKTAMLCSPSSGYSITDQKKLLSLKDTTVALHVALRKSIVEQSCGSALLQSCGLGLYFPKRYIHASYKKTTFDKETGWSLFLQKHLDKTRLLNAQHNREEESLTS